MHVTILKNKNMKVVQEIGFHVTNWFTMCRNH